MKSSDFFNLNTGNINPLNNNSYNIGSSSNNFKDLYMTGDIKTDNVFYINNGTNNIFEFSDNSTRIYSGDGTKYIGTYNNYNYSRGNFVSASDANYNLGDSSHIWGNLYMNGNIMTDGAFAIHDGVHNRFYFDSSLTGIYSPNGSNYLYANNNYIVSRGDFVPMTNNAYNLGRPTLQWYSLHAGYAMFYNGGVMASVYTSVTSSNANTGGCATRNSSAGSISTLQCNIYRGFYGSDSTAFHMHYYNGVIYATNNGTSDLTGAILTYGATSWSSPSDRRIKENIKDLSYGLDSINALKPVSFNYINYTDEESVTTDTKLGLIAQDAYEVIPEIVSVGSNEVVETNEDIKNIENPWSIEYTLLIPVLIKAVQELSDKIDILEGRTV